MQRKGHGCLSCDGGIITSTDCTISRQAPPSQRHLHHAPSSIAVTPPPLPPHRSNAGHGVMVKAAAATLSKTHVDFNARHGVHASEQSVSCSAATLCVMLLCVSCVVCGVWCVVCEV
jgi:hypothetical protein